MNIASLSWRNIWRNRIRSGVILTAIALGLFCGTFISVLLTGWELGAVNDDIASNLSHIEIHDPAFISNGDIYSFFYRSEAEETLKQSGIEMKVA